MNHSEQFLTCLTVLPSATHLATVVFLHGLGDSGNGWLNAARQMSKRLSNVKFILPNA